MLWVPTAQQASEVETSLAVLWPDAPLEVHVGDPVGDCVVWSGDTLHWSHGGTQVQADDIETAEAAVVLTRSWLREPERDLGWVPALPRTPLEPAEEDALDVSAPSNARPYAGVGPGKRIGVSGVPDALRLTFGVMLPRTSIAVTYSSAIPRGTVPGWVERVAEDGGRLPIGFEGSGTGGAVHLIGDLWPGPKNGPWTLDPIAAFGMGVRQRVLRRWRPNEPVEALPSNIDAGPEFGLGVQARFPGVAFRAMAVDRVGLLDGARQHVAVSVDVLVML